MKVSVSTIEAAQLEVDVLIVLASPATKNPFGKTGGNSIQEAWADFGGTPGEVVGTYPEKGLTARRVLLVGLEAEPDLEDIRRAAAVAAKNCRSQRSQTIGLVVPDASAAPDLVGQALVMGFMLGLYRFNRYKTNPPEDPDPERLVLQVAKDDKAVRAGAERGKIIAECVMTARDLVNYSPDEKTAPLLAIAIEQIAKKHGFEAVTWNKAMIEEEKMGGLLAVNRGSVEPPTFSVLEWRPDNFVNQKPIVLVGKGVVFDTGGLSLKPTKDSMDHMKADMSGGAAVVGIFEALARLRVPLHVVGLIPATDNRPGETAYVPGDVIRMHSGKTVEVLNTDAEGRMLLADALSYAKTYRPELVIDIATLTGAAVIALGDHVAAVMTNEGEGDEQRLLRMLESGERSGDRVHPMPMFDDYAEDIKSSIADLKNIGGRSGGAITAGKFLEHFTDYPWLHIDIAGPAFTTTDVGYRGCGGTGFGVHLLVDFLLARASVRKAR
jgi:leucyl aminopeptidase